MSVLAVNPADVAKWAELRGQLASSAPAKQAELLSNQARLARRQIIQMIDEAGQGHIGGDFSVIDVMTTLFSAVLNIDPADPTKDDRDRFILSKGHCSAALYTTLAFNGFFDRAELATFMQPYSALNGHPNRNKVPGVETNTGPLGHGLPVGVGTAIAAKLKKTSARTFVILGDGEMQEGSNWEALMSAAHFKLDNLTAIVDRNRLQQGARTEDTNGLDPLDEKLAAFGLEVREIDGHDFEALLNALAPSTTGKPVAIIANTKKGKGVSFIEDRVEWHHKVPSKDQVIQALEELS
jgi:transketolase